MLLILLLHIILTASCLWAGYIFYRYILKTEEKKPAVFYAVSGLIMLTLLSQVAVLFIPVNFYFSATIFFFLAFIAFFKRKSFRQFCQSITNEIFSLPGYIKALLAMLWLIILMINAGPLMMDDTESYHIQSIKWIQEYGSVPGIANLHERFGFNSSWFSSVALFSLLPETTGGYTVLNTVLSLWLCFYLLTVINRFVKDKNNLPAAMAVFFVLIASLAIWPMVRGNAATTNYDFIATTVVIILFLETLLSSEKEDGFSLSYEWVIWPVYLFTVRIINFPLLLLSLFSVFYILRKGNRKLCILPIIYCVLLILPFLTRNIIISGYPFYPASWLNLFSADWKADPAIMTELLNYITHYNRVSTTFMDIEQTSALGFPEWIPVWFRYLFTYDKLLVITGFIGLIWTFIIVLVKKSSFNNKAKFFVSALFISLSCWFFISPDPRFVYGCLLIGVFLLTYQTISALRINSFIKPVISFLPIFLILAAGYYVFSKPVQQKDYRNWIIPAALPQPPVKEITIDKITLRIPEPINNNWNARCFGTPLPCLYKVDPRLKLRGKNISSGFRLEK